MYGRQRGGDVVTAAVMGFDRAAYSDNAFLKTKIVPEGMISVI
jgi:hypothetical protein